jgi:hypothetical protein
MALDQATLKAIEAMLGGSPAQKRNGRSIKPAASDKEQLVPASMAELLSNKRTAADPGEGVPETAAVGVCNGKQCAVYPATIYGVTAVKVKGMPFKKDFFSLDTIRLMASEEFHMLLNEFLEQIPQ